MHALKYCDKIRFLNHCCFRIDISVIIVINIQYCSTVMLLHLDYGIHVFKCVYFFVILNLCVLTMIYLKINLIPTLVKNR